jgi:hypothetical protein
MFLNSSRNSSKEDHDPPALCPFVRLSGPRALIACRTWLRALVIRSLVSASNPGSDITVVSCDSTSSRSVWQSTSLLSIGGLGKVTRNYFVFGELAVPPAVRSGRLSARPSAVCRVLPSPPRETFPRRCPTRLWFALNSVGCGLAKCRSTCLGFRKMLPSELDNRVERHTRSGVALRSHEEHGLHGVRTARPESRSFP